MALYQAASWTAYHEPKRARDDESYWNKRAAGFAKHSGVSNYMREFIDLAQLDPSWTVLDVGCGSGALTVEVARRTAHATGIDISGRMLDLLSARAAMEGVDNLSTIRAAWEDDWDAAGVPYADLVMESRALLTPDLPMALRKLDERARARVCLTTVSGDLAYQDRRVVEAVGRSLPHPPDYIHVVTCLYDMGINADVRFISSAKHDRYATRDEARASLVAMLGGTVSPEEAERLHAFLDAHLVWDGTGWVKDYERRTDWAFISWDKR